MTVNTNTKGGVLPLAILGAKALGMAGKVALANSGTIKNIAKKTFLGSQKKKGVNKKLSKQSTVSNEELEEEQVAGKRRSRNRSRCKYGRKKTSRKGCKRKSGPKSRKSRSRSRSRKGRKTRKSRSRSRSRKPRKSRNRSRSRKGRRSH